MLRSGQVSISEAQLAGGRLDWASKIGAVSVRVAQLASAPTVWMKAVTSALMQATYCATVAVQVDGMSLHPRLSAHGSVDWQDISLLVQFCCVLATVGALLDAAYESPFHLHAVA